MSEHRRDVADAPAEGSAAASATLAECLDVLDRLVRAGALEAGSRGYALLSYLIDHHVKAGPDVPLKAYAIAVDVLGRASSFDPAQDSIVRVEVGRLRKLLDMYFRGPGASDPVSFVIPRGQSHLRLVRRDLEPAPESGTGQKPLARFLAARWPGAVLALIAVVIALGLTLGFGSLRGPRSNAEVEAALAEEFPRLFVQPFQKYGKVAEAFPRSALSSFLAGELSEFRTFRVIGPSFPTTLPLRSRDYLLEGTTLRKDAANERLVDLRLTLKDGFGTVLWKDTLHFDIADWGSPEPVLQAVSVIASTLGGTMGVIDTVGRARINAELAEWGTRTRSEFECILMWQSYDLTKGQEDRDRARRCLEQLADRQSRISQIWSALGFLLLLDWTEAGADPAAPEIQRALAAASHAVLLDPEGADGHETLGSILTALGRLPEARDTLERAAAINPSNLDTIVKLGWLDCLEGQWDTGRDRIRSVMDRYSVVPGWYRLPLALGAFHDGDAEAMLREATAIVETGDPRGLALAVVASRLAGDAEAGQRNLAALQAAGKDLPRAIRALEAVFPDKDLIAALLAQGG